MECACGLFAPTFSQQKPVYYPASQSSMKLAGDYRALAKAEFSASRIAGEKGTERNARE
jgi:hypothetical protein